MWRFLGPEVALWEARFALQSRISLLVEGSSPRRLPPASFGLLGAGTAAAALGFGELQSVKEINNVLGTTLLLSSLICLTQGKL